MFKGLALATCLSVCVALVVVLIFSLGEDTTPGYYFDAQMADGHDIVMVSQPIALDKEHIVSFLKRIPTEHSYLKVYLEQNRLWIDFYVGAEINDTDIYNDSFLIIAHLYTQTVNIDQLNIRFVDHTEKGTDSPVVIAQVNSVKSEEMSSALNFNVDNLDARQFLEKYTQLNIKTTWRP